VKRLLSEQGMLVVLLGLCAYFSWRTYQEVFPEGAAAAEQIVATLADEAEPGARVLIVAQPTQLDGSFVAALEMGLKADAFDVAGSVRGSPKDGRDRLKELAAENRPLDYIVCTSTTVRWQIFEGLEGDFPSLGKPALIAPRASKWPLFLTTGNLLNIANQIAIIAMIAIGMTMVIITAGIDLSVGSLIALSAVVCGLYIERVGEGLTAGTGQLWIGSLLGILSCGLCGAVVGLTVTVFVVPPFIVTLAMMMVARGIALSLTGGESIGAIPASFTWLGRETSLGLPNAVWLTIALYAVAHIAMTRTIFGRYLYAVGGNAEAARLSGVPVKRVVLIAYLISGLLAGVGGVVMASQLKSATPNYGEMYELYVIAAVVVGGTSLSGGEGKVIGTLIGALIIAVIQNGMNLDKIDPFTQRIVLGVLILVAVLIDTLKHRRGKV
jgi:ribose transport system permease protein